MALLEERYPSFKFEKPGDTFEGTILSVTELDDVDPATKTVKTWPGTDRPIKVWVLAVEPENGETRAIWVRSHLVTAMREAAKEGQIKQLEGSTVKIRFDRLGEKKTGLSQAHLFKVRLTPGTSKATSTILDDEEDPF